MTFPEFLVEQVVNEIVGRVFGLRDFLQDDLALALYLGGIENRVEEMSASTSVAISRSLPSTLA